MMFIFIGLQMILTVLFDDFYKTIICHSSLEWSFLEPEFIDIPLASSDSPNSYSNSLNAISFFSSLSKI